MNLDWYDYGARFYDPSLGRWHAADPLAEKYNNTTPYSYVASNPLKFIDPNGMSYKSSMDDMYGEDNYDRRGSKAGTWGGNVTKGDPNKNEEESHELIDVFSISAAAVAELGGARKIRKLLK